MIWNTYAGLPFGQALYISFPQGGIPTIEMMTVELLDTHYSGLNIHNALVLFLGEFKSIQSLKDFLETSV